MRLLGMVTTAPASQRPATQRALWTLAGSAALASIVSMIVSIAALARDTVDFTFSPVSRDGDAIIIDRPDSIPLNRCLALKGSAPWEGNADLWVIHRTSDSPDIYYHKATRLAGSERWEVPNIFLGDDAKAGLTVDFIAFFIDEDMSEFIDSVQPGGAPPDKVYWFTKSLPPGISSVAPQLPAVERSSTVGAGCASP